MKRGRSLIYAGIAALAVLFIVISNIIAAPNEHDARVVFLRDSEYLPMIIQDIARSSKEVKCAVYMFKTDGYNNNTTRFILDAMMGAASRGVSVSVLMDVSEGTDFVTEYNRQTGNTLLKSGAEVLYDNPEQRLHAKLCVIDGELTYLGSHNFTYSAMARNAEVSVRVRSKEIAAEAIEYINKTANAVNTGGLEEGGAGIEY